MIKNKYKSKEEFEEFLYDYYLIELSDMVVTKSGDIITYEGVLNPEDDEEIQWLGSFNEKTQIGDLLPPIF